MRKRYQTISNERKARSAPGVRLLLALFLLILLSVTAAFGQEQLNDYEATVANLANRNIEFSGSCNVTITSATAPLSGSSINLLSDDIWLYFPNILPSSVAANELDHIAVNGAAAVADQNIRVVQYLQGTMVISHSSDYQALTVYSNNNQSGSSMQMGNYTYYKAAQLGSMNDNIQSFVLKRGYMVTIAANEDGTGASENYVADEEDIIVDQMPSGLSNAASFVRVIPWRWTAKKGWARTSDKASLLNASWQYDWDNVRTSSLNVEYIPMRHNKWWNSYGNIHNKTNSTHALHFNEPDNPNDDGYATVAEAIAQWPEMLASGLRVGTPAPTDGGAQWLYDFVDACEANNYRVDFAVIHFYRGGQTTQQFYNFLLNIHNTTGLPVWVTEFNNGANWTCCDPTYASQAETIDDWMDMLESAPFVERYAIYENVEDTRKMFYSGTNDHTPAGIVYRDKTSTMAYQGGSDAGIVSGQTYSIVARHSGKALDATGTTNNSNVQQYSYWGGNNQRWTVELTSGGYYRLINVASGRALDAAGTSNGSQCQIYSYWGGSNQQWAINDLGNGYYSITSKGSGRAVDIAGQSKANKALATIYDYWGGQNQQFQFNLVGSSSRTTEEQKTEEVSVDFTVYPNPVFDKLHIRSGSDFSQAEVYSISGQLISSGQLQQNTLDVSTLKPGIYMLRLIDGNQLQELKFIKSE